MLFSTGYPSNDINPNRFGSWGVLSSFLGFGNPCLFGAFSRFRVGGQSQRDCGFQPSRATSWRWIIQGETFPSSTPKALLRVPQGWQCEASYPGFELSLVFSTLKALLPKRFRRQ